MSKYLNVQDPFDKHRRVKALRPKVSMGGPVTRNGKEVHVGVSKSKALKNKAHRTITLKSGEEWPVGKKSRERKEKPLRSWGDEFGKRGFTK